MGRKDIMENYVGTNSGKVIKDFNNGLFVKIKDKEGNLLQVDSCS